MGSLEVWIAPPDHPAEPVRVRTGDLAAASCLGCRAEVWVYGGSRPGTWWALLLDVGRVGPDLLCTVHGHDLGPEDLD